MTAIHFDTVSSETKLNNISKQQCTKAKKQVPISAVNFYLAFQKWKKIFWPFFNRIQKANRESPDTIETSLQSHGQRGVIM